MNEKNNFKNTKRKQITYFSLILIAPILLYIVNTSPINSKLMGLIKIFLIFIIWLGIFNLLPKRIFKIFWIFFPTLVVLLLMSISKPINSKELNELYMKELKSFDKVNYFWGGESSNGIDCSGLPRRSLRNAYLKYAIKNLNGKAIFLFMENWWYDSSALALMKNYRKYVVDKKISGTIKTISYKNLKPGDLAITKSGLHVIVYFGNNLWIQADPDKKIVIIQNGKTDKNMWFYQQINIFRWKQM